MSKEKLGLDAERWYRQSVDDLDAATVLLTAQKYAQAYFYAQQVTEKALKAIWIRLDLDSWGHSAARLIRELPDTVKPNFASLLELALGLDKLYILTRYPNALPNLMPSEAYTQRETETVIQAAQTILNI